MPFDVDRAGRLRTSSPGVSRASDIRVPTAAYAAIIASATDAVIVLDERQRIMLFNAAAERMFGCAAADVIGTPLDRLLPPGVRRDHADFIRRFGETDAALRTMAPNRPLTALRSDGSEFPIQAQISHVNVDGRRFYTAIVRDVTERRRATEAQARLAAIVASSDDAIVGKDLTGIITDWNAGAERVFGYTRKEAIGRSILMLLPPERQHEEAKILATLRRGDRIDHFETVRVRKDGTRIDVSVSVSPIKDDTGRIVGAAKIARDVTERRLIEAERDRLLAAEQAARAQAEEASRAKDEFLSMVSHELRTPLAAILGWAAVLRQGSLSPERQRRALETIERSGRVQSELIEDLLDVSRIISGRLRLTLRPTSIRAVVEAAVDAARPEASAAGVRLVTHLDTNARVAGDEVRLQQVVSNVLGNAIKFTPRDGRIDVDVGVAPGGDTVRITVQDTGRGITPDFLLHVFEPFRQAEDVKSRKKGGLGLGLAIARHLVQEHRGRIVVESPGAGLGTTVTVTLPVLSGAAETAEHDPLPRLDGLRVLIVEDDDEARRALSAVLEDRGAIVVAASSALDARTRLRAADLDVVVSDIRLPGEDGYAFIRELRQHEGLRAIPAVAVTAYDAEENSARALAAGFHAHFGKPYDPAVLIGAIASLAGREVD